MKVGILVVVVLALVGCEGQKGKSAREWNLESKPEVHPQVDDSGTAQELGVALYPKSATPPGLPPISRTSVLGVATVDCWRETVDSPVKVGEFYKTELAAQDVETSKGGVTVEGKNLRGENVRVIATRGDGAKLTAIVITVTKKEIGAKD